MRECIACGSDDVEFYAAESDDESDVLHCYMCGVDERLDS